MECSALAACAAFRDATWGMILYTADSLAEVDRYDERNWGGNAYEYALTLCMDCCTGGIKKIRGRYDFCKKTGFLYYGI